MEIYLLVIVICSLLSNFLMSKQITDNKRDTQKYLLNLDQAIRYLSISTAVDLGENYIPQIGETMYHLKDNAMTELPNGIYNNKGIIYFVEESKLKRTHTIL